MDLVVPFVGPASSLTALVRRLAAVRVQPGDTVTVADNRPLGAAPVGGFDRVGVVRAPEAQSSYFARNRAAERGDCEWLLFVDADVLMPTDLLDRYFMEPAGQSVGILAGEVMDEPVGDGSPAVARFAMLAGTMSQSNTLDDRRWAYAQTANCAIRRAAFEAVGGFTSDIRSGGDADICFRVKQAGWAMERRTAAHVVHQSRRTLRKLLRQRARMGSGAAWLNRRYPGSFPPRNPLGLLKWGLLSLGGATLTAARGHRDDALVAAIDTLVVWAFELGRLVPNEVR